MVICPEWPEQFAQLAPIWREHPVLCYLLLKKHRTRKQCAQMIPRLLRAIYELR